MKSILTMMLCCLLVTAARAEINVVDLVGRSVTLQAPAQRIIGLAPHIVENTFSAGAGDKLVGVVSYSDYPAAAKKIAKVGDYRSWSLETIVELKPDLVLMWSSGNGMKSLAKLERMGLTVYVSEPRELQDIPATIRAIGTLAGTQAIADVEAGRVENELTRLATKYGRRQPVSVFYQIWNQPLQTLSGDHFISNVIELCGGQNAFADAATLTPKINIESVLQRNPDAIIASGMGAARPEWLDEWQNFPALKAVSNNALFLVHPDHIQRPTARVLLGATQMCNYLASVAKP